ncbi:MAG: hypothetical protein QOE61_2944 [Micromonosporaceae bacterium]|jgi:hypothetical protein|nr:hypothetical protein [Micromonosporaceae bacterium]
MDLGHFVTAGGIELTKIAEMRWAPPIPGTRAALKEASKGHLYIERRFSVLGIRLVPVGHVGYEGRIVVVLQTLSQFGSGWPYVHHRILGENIGFAIVDDTRGVEMFRHADPLPIQ